MKINRAPVIKFIKINSNFVCLCIMILSESFLLLITKIAHMMEKVIRVKINNIWIILLPIDFSPTKQSFYKFTRRRNSSPFREIKVFY
jgi:hypothetical protein